MDSLLKNESTGQLPTPVPPITLPPDVSPLGGTSESVGGAITPVFTGLSQLIGDAKTTPYDAEAYKQQFLAVLNGTHANAVALLNSAWNCDNPNSEQLRQVIINSMASYYNQNPDDQSRLNKVLEIAHELKPNGLAELFNLQQFPFVIDLACLAQRREFLKLEKFLKDKLSSEGGEAFARHLLGFIKRKCPGIGISPIPSETFTIIFNELKESTKVWPFITAELQQLLAQIRTMQVCNQCTNTACPAILP